MLEVARYTPGDAGRWDAFCASAINATFLHTRRFLAYHGDRLQDASLLLSHDGELVAVIPAASVPGDASVVASHPGATYGGLVHAGWLTGERALEALQACMAAWQQMGFGTLRYKAIPSIYQRRPAQDDLYALFRLGAQRFRCDLSCTIDLASRGPSSSRRKRSLAKALRQVQLVDGPQLLPAYWSVLEDNLARKHGARPVHTLDEITSLAELFPDRIQLRCATIGGQVEAGVLLFVSEGVWHAQYIAASASAYDAGALDAVFDAAIGAAAAAGARYFDFGTSNEDGGRVLNEGLYRFKSEFGGGGVVQEQYEVTLAPRP